jgi:hypothetical protein
MRFHHALFAAAVALLGCASLSAEEKRPELTPPARVEIIRRLNAEIVWLRQDFPQGEKGLTLTPDGRLSPEPGVVVQRIAKFGPAGRKGDKALITGIEFKGSSIVFEINGGNKKKKGWLQRIEIGAGGGSRPIDNRPEEIRRGSSIALKFKGHIPELTVDELKKLLEPVFDFSTRSAATAFLDQFPPKVAEAIKNHQILVGMNKELVTHAKGRPGQKIRERDAQGRDTEEWIYGEPPQDVEFVKFVGDEVVQLKIMKVDGEKIVRTEKEVDLSEKPAMAQAATEPEQSKGMQGTKRPTLVRPGETAPTLPGNEPPPTLPPPADSPKPLAPADAPRL